MKAKRILLLLAFLAVPLLILILDRAGTRAAWNEVETGLLEGRLRPCPEGVDCLRGESGEEDALEPFALPGEDSEAGFEALVRFLVLENDATLLEQEAGYARLVFAVVFLERVHELELRLDPDASVARARIFLRAGHSLGTPDELAGRLEVLRARWNLSAERRALEPDEPART